MMAKIFFSKRQIRYHLDYLWEGELEYPVSFASYRGKRIDPIREGTDWRIRERIRLLNNALNCSVPQLMSVLLKEFLTAFDIFSVFVEIDFVHID